MVEIFDSGSETVTILVNGTSVVKELPLSVDDLKEVARDAGVRKYTVMQDGEELIGNDFPVTVAADVVIKEYNEAK